MKYILNMLLLFSVVYFGSRFFPTCIVSNGILTICWVAVIMFAINIASNILFLVFYIGVGKLIGSDSTLFHLVVALTGNILLFTLPIIELFICTRVVHGFTINGVLPYILLAVAINMFNVRKPKTDAE